MQDLTLDVVLVNRTTATESDFTIAPKVPTDERNATQK